MIRPNTLLLGIWAAENRAAITGSLTDWRGDTLSDVLACTGEPWTTLVRALECAQVVGAGDVLILSNDAALVRALSPPLAVPAPTRTERVFYSRTEWAAAEWADVGTGGDAQHWQALRLLGGQWGGRFKAMQVDDLPKARELWQSQSKSKSQT